MRNKNTFHTGGLNQSNHQISVKLKQWI